MTITRNSAVAILVAGLAAAILCYRLQHSQWAQFSPAWHRFVRDGDATIAALLLALVGLFLILRR